VQTACGLVQNKPIYYTLMPKYLRALLWHNSRPNLLSLNINNRVTMKFMHYKGHLSLASIHHVQVINVDYVWWMSVSFMSKLTHKSVNQLWLCTRRPASHVYILRLFVSENAVKYKHKFTTFSAKGQDLIGSRCLCGVHLMLLLSDSQLQF
jgi:hypothetical protein